MASSLLGTIGRHTSPRGPSASVDAWDEKVPVHENLEFFRTSITIKGARDLVRHDVLGKSDPVILQFIYLSLIYVIAVLRCSNEWSLL
jgi:hypothetical protein